MHRRHLPGDHLCQRRSDRLLTTGRQPRPQSIQLHNRRRFRDLTHIRRNTGRGGTAGRRDMTHLLVFEPGVPGTTSPALITPLR